MSCYLSIYQLISLCSNVVQNDKCQNAYKLHLKKDRSGNNYLSTPKFILRDWQSQQTSSEEYPSQYWRSYTCVARYIRTAGNKAATREREVGGRGHVHACRRLITYKKIIVYFKNPALLAQFNSMNHQLPLLVGIDYTQIHYFILHVSSWKFQQGKKNVIQNPHVFYLISFDYQKTGIWHDGIL
jgi:hypothetical protein